MLSYITWTVRPDIFTIGNWEVRWYGFLFALGFYLGYQIGSRMILKDKGKESWPDILFLYLIVGTVVGARLGHCLFYEWGYFSHHLLEIFKVWEGGLSSHGGTLGCVVGIWIYSRYVTHRSMLWTFDYTVIPTGMVAGFIRLGNLMNHEIYGEPTSLPWGFRFIENLRQWQHGAKPIYSMPSHPTQIYEALCYFATFIILYILYKTKPMFKRREGLTIGIFFIGIFFTRFLIEFIKQDQESFEATMFLNMGQWLSIPFILAGIVMIIRAHKRPPVFYEGMEEEEEAYLRSKK